MVQLARGATPVRMQIAKYMKDAFPAMRERAVREWRLQRPGDLPVIDIFNPFDNIAFNNDTPTVLGVDVNRATNFGNTEVSGGEEEQTVRYNVRVNVWTFSEQDAEGVTLGPQRASAIRRRDDLVGVCKAILLDRPSMGCDFLAFNASTLTIDYHFANPTPNTSQRYFAGAQLTFDVMCDEWLSRTPIGSPSEPVEITVDAKVVNDNREDAYSTIGLMK